MTPTHARSQLANTVKWHPDDHAAIAAARARLASAIAEQRISEAIDKLVAAAPPLTAEQRSRLSLLLHPGHAG